MSNWTADQLDSIGAADELDIVPRRADGSPGRATTIWVVRAGSDLYVRSWRGPQGRWFTAAKQTGEGHIRAGGVDRDVAFQPAETVDRRAIDGAYRAKYGRSSYVDAMVTDTAAATTLRLIPR
jgi:hypothetical protein